MNSDRLKPLLPEDLDAALEEAAREAGARG